MTNLRIISRSSQPFHDRREAGRLLGDALDHLYGRHPVVLGVPRGGVIVAQELAHRLDGDLDVVLAHKLGAPGHRELAIGAVAEDGTVLVDDDIVDRLGIGRAYLEEEEARVRSAMRSRAELFRKALPKVTLRGREVLVTDDGVATGATVRAALIAVRQEEPLSLTAAVPVGSEDALRLLSREADEVVCLRVPPLFDAVGRFYTWFQQVEDEEVVEALKREAARRGVDTAARGLGGS